MDNEITENDIEELVKQKNTRDYTKPKYPFLSKKLREDVIKGMGLRLNERHFAKIDFIMENTNAKSKLSLLKKYIEEGLRRELFKITGEYFD